MGEVDDTRANVGRHVGGYEITAESVDDGIYDVAMDKSVVDRWKIAEGDDITIMLDQCGPGFHPGQIAVSKHHIKPVAVPIYDRIRPPIGVQTPGDDSGAGERDQPADCAERGGKKTVIITQHRDIFAGAGGEHAFPVRRHRQYPVGSYMLD